MKRNKFSQFPISLIIIIPLLIINQIIRIFSDHDFSFEALFEDILIVALGYTIYFVIAVLILMYKFHQSNKEKEEDD